MVSASVRRLEGLFFRHRAATLVVLGVLTLAMGWFASQLRMSAGFDKQLPVGHEYIDTFFQYREEIFGANRVIVVVKARQGDIWNQPALERLYDVTQAVYFLPGVDRRAFVWRFVLDDGARPIEVTLTRAVVRSRAQWSYDDAQRAIDAGEAPGSLLAMPWFGAHFQGSTAASMRLRPWALAW